MEFVIGLVLLIIILEFASYVVYGPLLSDKEIDEFLNGCDEFDVNVFNKRIIQPKNGDFGRLYITNLPITLLCKYCISNKGRIPLWSNGHQKIKKIFNNLK
jgi:hypothetical protein